MFMIEPAQMTQRILRSYRKAIQSSKTSQSQLSIPKIMIIIMIMMSRRLVLVKIYQIPAALRHRVFRIQIYELMPVRELIDHDLASSNLNYSVGSNLIDFVFRILSNGQD